ncbi:hypothetical protein [Kordia jejudonensis]|uniref:hypothetical protein n=1 Tax=Kordia jejudonensis TaxID=1348245 RepID=UPI000629BE88|nr:hypothetical protein [Kordia jejudonensis]
MNKEVLQEKIEAEKELSFEHIMSESGTLFTKVWGQALLSSLLISVVSAGMAILCFIPYMITLLSLGISSKFIDLHSSNDDRFEIFSIIFSGIFSVLAAAVFIAISAAFIRICKMKDHNRQGYHDFFFFFKKTYYSKLLLLGAIAMAISIPSAYYLSYIPLVYLIVPIFYGITIFTFNYELNVKDIISLGFKLGTEKWLISLGFLFIVSFFSVVVGMLLCGFGFIATMTFVHIPLYVIYKNIVGFDDEKPVDAYQEKTDLIIQKINELNINDQKK